MNTFNSIGFWGLIVEPDKLYTQHVSTPIRLTMACLGPDVFSDEENISSSASQFRISHSPTISDFPSAKHISTPKNSHKTDSHYSDDATYSPRPSLLILNHKKHGEFVICSLSPKICHQQILDIFFSPGEVIHIRVAGKYAMHLTGHLFDAHVSLSALETRHQYPVHNKTNLPIICKSIPSSDEDLDSDEAGLDEEGLRLFEKIRKGEPFNAKFLPPTPAHSNHSKVAASVASKSNEIYMESNSKKIDKGVSNKFDCHLNQPISKVGKCETKNNSSTRSEIFKGKSKNDEISIKSMNSKNEKISTKSSSNNISNSAVVVCKDFIPKNISSHGVMESANQTRGSTINKEIMDKSIVEKLLANCSASFLNDGKVLSSSECFPPNIGSKLDSKVNPDHKLTLTPDSNSGSDPRASSTNSGRAEKPNYHTVNLLEVGKNAASKVCDNSKPKKSRENTSQTTIKSVPIITPLPSPPNSPNVKFTNDESILPKIVSSDKSSSSSNSLENFHRFIEILKNSDRKFVDSDHSASHESRPTISSANVDLWKKRPSSCNLGPLEFMDTKIGTGIKARGNRKVTIKYTVLGSQDEILSNACNSNSRCWGESIILSFDLQDSLYQPFLHAGISGMAIGGERIIFVPRKTIQLDAFPLMNDVALRSSNVIIITVSLDKVDPFSTVAK